MKNNKILSMLGLATRAGAVATGAFLSEKAVKSGKAAIVIVAADASANTEKKFYDMCSFYKVDCFTYGDKNSLGHCCGKEERSVITVLDKGFGNSVKKLIGESRSYEGGNNGKNEDI